MLTEVVAHLALENQVNELVSQALQPYETMMMIFSIIVGCSGVLFALMLAVLGARMLWIRFQQRRTSDDIKKSMDEMGSIEQRVNDRLLAERSFSFAEDQRRKGNLPLARSAYKTAMEYFPQDVETAVRYGAILIELGDYDSAVHHYKRAIELFPENTYFQIDLARAYSKNSQYAEAIETLENVLRRIPRNANLLELMGDQYRAIDNLEAALQYYKQSGLEKMGQSTAEKRFCVLIDLYRKATSQETRAVGVREIEIFFEDMKDVGYDVLRGIIGSALVDHRIAPDLGNEPRIVAALSPFIGGSQTHQLLP